MIVLEQVTKVYPTRSGPRQVLAGKSQPASPAPDMSGVGDASLRAALEQLHRNLSRR